MSGCDVSVYDTITWQCVMYRQDIDVYTVCAILSTRQRQKISKNLCRSCSVNVIVGQCFKFKRTFTEKAHWMPLLDSVSSWRELLPKKLTECRCWTVFQVEKNFYQKGSLNKCRCLTVCQLAHAVKRQELWMHECRDWVVWCPWTCLSCQVGQPCSSFYPEWCWRQPYVDW